MGVPKKHQRLFRLFKQAQRHTKVACYDALRRKRNLHNCQECCQGLFTVMSVFVDRCTGARVSEFCVPMSDFRFPCEP